MSDLARILLEKLGSIPKLIDACSFYITCAGIKELLLPVFPVIVAFLAFRLLSKFLNTAMKEDLSR